MTENQTKKLREIIAKKNLIIRKLYSKIKRLEDEVQDKSRGIHQYAQTTELKLTNRSSQTLRIGRRYKVRCPATITGRMTKSAWTQNSPTMKSRHTEMKCLSVASAT